MIDGDVGEMLPKDGAMRLANALAKRAWARLDLLMGVSSGAGADDGDAGRSDSSAFEKTKACGRCD